MGADGIGKMSVLISNKLKATARVGRDGSGVVCMLNVDGPDFPPGVAGWLVG